MQFSVVGGDVVGGLGEGAGLTGSKHLSHDTGHASRTILLLRYLSQYFCFCSAVLPTYQHPRTLPSEDVKV